MPKEQLEQLKQKFPTKSVTDHIGGVGEVKIKSDEHIRLPFETIKSYDFTKKIHLKNREDTLNLLKMTPHFYHIKKERRYVLDTLGEFDVTIDIRITVYKI